MELPAQRRLALCRQARAKHKVRAADKEIRNNFTTRCQRAAKYHDHCTHTHTDGGGCTSRGTPREPAVPGWAMQVRGSPYIKRHGERPGNHHPDRKKLRNKIRMHAKAAWNKAILRWDAGNVLEIHRGER